MPDLLIRFKADSKEVREEIRKLGGQVQRELGADKAQAALFKDLGNQARQLGGDITRVFRGDITGAFDAMRNSAGIAGSAMTGLGATAATAAVGIGALAAAVAALEAAFLLVAFRQAEFLDQIGDIAEETGISADVVLQFRQAFTAFSGDANGAQQALERFTTTVGRALAQPTNDAAKALRQLGINAREAAQNPSGALLQLADRFARIETQAERARVASELFGRGGAQLAAVLVEMSKSARDFESAIAAVGGRDEFNKLVNQAGEFDAELRRMQNTIQTAALVIVREFLPTLRAFNEQLGPIIRDLMPALVIAAQAAELAFRALLATMSSLAKGMADITEAGQAISRGEFGQAIEELRQSLTHPVWKEWNEITARRNQLLKEGAAAGAGAGGITPPEGDADAALAARRREVANRFAIEQAGLERERAELELQLSRQEISHVAFEEGVTAIKLRELEARLRMEEDTARLQKLSQQALLDETLRITGEFIIRRETIMLEGSRRLQEQIKKDVEEMQRQTFETIGKETSFETVLPEDAFKIPTEVPTRTIFTELRDQIGGKDGLIVEMKKLENQARPVVRAIQDIGRAASDAFQALFEGTSTLKQAAGAMAAALLEPFIVYAQQQAAIAALESAMAFLRLDFVGGAKWAAIAAGWAALSGGLAAIGSAAQGAGGGGGGGGGTGGATGTSAQPRELEDRIRYWEGGAMQPVTTIIIKHEEGMFVDKVEQAMITSFQNDGAARRIVKRETEGTPIR
jgi:hypothetical protein